MLAAIRAVDPDVPVELWAQDEARIGLHPIERRVWAKRGHRPVAVQHPGYEWLYVYGFVRPTTGEVEWLLMPTVNAWCFSEALRRFAEAVGAGPQKRIILVVDNAGFHVGKDVVWPPGIFPLFLPPYSPELQPAEKLWPLLHEPLANRLLTSLDEVERILVDRCCDLYGQSSLIAGCTRKSWWLQADPAKS